MGTLFEWFRSRKEAKIIKKTRMHVKKVHDIIVELKIVILAIDKKDYDAVRLGVKRINEIENECDDIRREVMVNLSKSELIPAVREDLAHLIKRLDDIANNANGFARRLNLIQNLEILSPITAKMIEIVDLSLKSVEKVRTLVDELLKEESTQLVKIVQEVGKLEHDVDNLHYEIKRTLQKIDYTDISPFTATVVYEMINRLESITDSAEDVADLIRLLYLERF